MRHIDPFIYDPDGHACAIDAVILQPTEKGTARYSIGIVFSCEDKPCDFIFWHWPLIGVYRSHSWIFQQNCLPLGSNSGSNTQERTNLLNLLVRKNLNAWDCA